MKLKGLKKELKQYLHMEDDSIIDVLMASIIANRLRLSGDPVWLIVIGVSSGGKSQILRPISLIDDEDDDNKRIIHKIDDLTENTFLSGMKGAGDDQSTSLLKRIGNVGIFIISDFTVLFSKSSETRGAIFSQFRMLYDGEMTKMSGNMKKSLHWEGYLGILAGCTPSVYPHFEEYGDMGERFMYYRMKENDDDAVVDLALHRDLGGRDLDKRIGELYQEYIKDVIVNTDREEKVVLPEKVIKRIKEVALLAEKIRTPIKTDFKGEVITHIPLTASSARSAQQLATIAKGLQVMTLHEGKKDIDLDIIDWLAFSFANEEKRKVLQLLAEYDFDDTGIQSGKLEDDMGLNKRVIEQILLNLTAVGIVEKNGQGFETTYKIKHEKDWEIVRRLNSIDVKKKGEFRQNMDEF